MLYVAEPLQPSLIKFFFNIFLKLWSRLNGEREKEKNKQDKTAKPDERLEVGQYTGSVPDIDLEAAKERAREYDKKVLRPEKEKEIRDSQEKYKELIDTEKDFLDFFNEDKYKFQVEYKGKLFDIEITYIDPEKTISLSWKWILGKYSVTLTVKSKR